MFHKLTREETRHKEVGCMRKEEALNKLRENKEKLKDFGVKRIEIFDSIVRGEAKGDSDIDVVIEFEREKATF